MIINEGELTKGQLRKLTGLRKSLGPRIADSAFIRWLKQEETKKVRVFNDPVARKIEEAVGHLSALNLGLHGYTIKRGKGRGDKGIQVSKNSSKAS